MVVFDEHYEKFHRNIPYQDIYIFLKQEIPEISAKISVIIIGKKGSLKLLPHHRTC